MKCVICQYGETEPGTTTVTLTRDETTVVIRFEGDPGRRSAISLDRSSRVETIAFRSPLVQLFIQASVPLAAMPCVERAYY
jgi:hypothetical protein